MMINEVPDGVRGHIGKQALREHNARGDLHRLGDPADWGWRRPTLDELVLERLDWNLDELG